MIDLVCIYLKCIFTRGTDESYLFGDIFLIYTVFSDTKIFDLDDNLGIIFLEDESLPTLFLKRKIHTGTRTITIELLCARIILF